MTKQQGVTIRYSISFKQKVVREVEEEGLTMDEAARRYGIKGGGSTVLRWIRKFGKNHLLNKVVRVETREEKDRLKQLEAEVKKLKIALADATLEKKALETLVEVVNEHYHADVKKTLGQKPSDGPQKKKDVQ